MPLPLLKTPPLTNNARVRSFSLGSDETPRLSAAKGPVSAATLDEQIELAYRQIFFHAFKVDREPVLESRLRSGQISVREFGRGLLYSNKFRNEFYRCNSNYRMVDQIVGRVLGRPVHGQQERIALSILLAQQGVGGLADHLLDSQEYRDAFGDDTIPHQRSRRSWNDLDPERQRQLQSASAGIAGRGPLTPGPQDLTGSGHGRWFRPNGLCALHRSHHAQHPRRGLIGAWSAQAIRSSMNGCSPSS